MTEPGNTSAASQYWERDGIGTAILDELRSSGKNPDHLTIHDLAPYDQYHGGGMPMTVSLARAAGLKPGMRVLDVGGGLGGPARTLATEFGCDVTVADLTSSYLEAGRLLTSLLKLDTSVRFVQADALNLPFENKSFDLIWTQNSGMNIQDKARLYAGFHRLLRPDGVLAFQEPMAGEVQPPIYPLMWARDATTNFICSPEEIKSLIEKSGFTVNDWQDATDILEEFRARMTYPGRGIQALVMGDRLAEISAATKRNTVEKRVVLVQAVFQKVKP